MEKKYSLQIIAGKYKGKKLSIPSKSITRSSKSIIRGSVFDTLQFDIIDSNFVEVFAGSGSIGIEAMSRGAKKTFFIEKDREAFNILNDNLKIADDSDYEVLFGDSFEKIDEIIDILKNNNETSYFYLDPPFPIRDNMKNIYDKIIEMIEMIPSEIVKLIIIEHMSSIQFPENIKNFQQIKTKKFGKTSLSYYTR